MSENPNHSYNNSARRWFVKHPSNEQSNNSTGFLDLIKTAVNEAMAEATVPHLANEKPINQKELAKYLNVSERTIMRWRDKGDVPYLQLGSRVLYQTSEVLEALKVKKR